LKAAGGVFAWLLAEQNRYNPDRREDQVPLHPAQDPAYVGPQSALSPNGRRPQSSRTLPVGARAVHSSGQRDAQCHPGDHGQCNGKPPERPSERS
jgi:hypothetical protein